MPEDSYAYTPAKKFRSPNTLHSPLPLLNSEPDDRRWRMLPESEPLLPQTNHRSHPTTHTYRAVGAVRTGSAGRRPFAVDFFVSLLTVLLLLAIIVGVLWVGIL
jgi:hypothetical protein